MATVALVSDVGGTRMRAALIDRESRIIQRKSVSTQASEGQPAVFRRFMNLLHEVEALAEQDEIVGIGVCMPGPIDPFTGILYNPPNLPGWDDFPLKSSLQQEFDYPVAVGNDANLAGLAEHRFGAAKGHRNAVYLTVSTGIGGGVIIENNLLLGSNGFAAELGHVTVDRRGPVAPNGVVGSLEYLASGTATGRIARERVSAGEASSLSEKVNGDLAKISAQLVCDAAEEGDSLAMSVIEDVATTLGFGIVNIMHTFDPDVVVIGGGMSNRLSLLLPHINQAIDEHAMANFRGRRPVVKSALGDDAGLVGAAALVFVETGSESG